MAEQEVVNICKKHGPVVDVQLLRSISPSTFGHRRRGGFVWYRLKADRNKALRQLPREGIPTALPRWEINAPSIIDDKILLQVKRMDLPPSLGHAVLETFDAVKDKRYG